MISLEEHGQVQPDGGDSTEGSHAASASTWSAMVRG